jgi:hypothetical protein
MRGGKRVLLWVGLGSALACCLGLTIPLWLALNGNDNLDRALADYRRQGLPWTAAEVDPTPKPSEADNAATLLNRAIDAFKGKSVLSDASDAWTLLADGKLDEADKLVSKYKSSITLAKEAARRPNAYFQKDWDLGPMVLFPEMAPAKTLVRLVAERGMIESGRGQVDSSLSDLQDAWTISKFFGQSPSLIGLLVQIASNAITLNAFQQAMTDYRDNPRALISLESQLDGMSDPFDFRRTVRSEAYMGLVILRNGSLFRSQLGTVSDGGPDSPPIDPRKIRRTGDPNGLIERFAGGKLIKAYVELDKIAQRDGADTTRLDADLKEFEKKIEADDGLTARYRNMLLPSFSNLGQAMLEDKARLLTEKA